MRRITNKISRFILGEKIKSPESYKVKKLEDGFNVSLCVALKKIILEGLEGR